MILWSPALDEFPSRPMVAQGTPEERKSFVRTFITEIRIHPHEARGTVRIRRFPLPPEGNSGNSSFKLVAGTRVEVEKNTATAQDRQEIDHLLEVVFGANGTSLVPG